MDYLLKSMGLVKGRKDSGIDRHLVEAQPAQRLSTHMPYFHPFRGAPAQRLIFASCLVIPGRGGTRLAAIRQQAHSQRRDYLVPHVPLDLPAEGRAPA